MKNCKSITSIFCTLAAASVTALAAPQMAVAQEKPVFEQVVEIVGSNRGTVRKWTYAPKLTVIHDGDPQRDHIHQMVEKVNASIPNFPGVGDVEFFDLNQYQRRLAGNTNFRMRATDFNGVEGSYR